MHYVGGVLRMLKLARQQLSSLEACTCVMSQQQQRVRCFFEGRVVRPVKSLRVVVSALSAPFLLEQPELTGPDGRATDRRFMPHMR